MFLTGRAKRQRALELLDMVGLSHRKNNKLDNCQAVNSSVWQLPLLANNFSLLLADEPTGGC